MFFLIFENIISSFLLMLFGAKYTSLVGGFPKLKGNKKHKFFKISCYNHWLYHQFELLWNL
tara:strand:+ start:1087 stop:1269 length:183 start_codon:yes stop_codon:yes gene_type:complete